MIAHILDLDAALRGAHVHGDNRLDSGPNRAEFVDAVSNVLTVSGDEARQLRTSTMRGPTQHSMSGLGLCCEQPCRSNGSIMDCLAEPQADNAA